jgi:hypothetical protein
LRSIFTDVHVHLLIPTSEFIWWQEDNLFSNLSSDEIDTAGKMLFDSLWFLLRHSITDRVYMESLPRSGVR